jgi:hypothetical protein
VSALDYAYWLEDPGHSWLAVPMDEVIESGCEVSVFSYVKDNHVYLEEDCDAPAFLDALDIPHSRVANLERVQGNPRGWRTYPFAVRP